MVNLVNGEHQVGPRCTGSLRLLEALSRPIAAHIA